MKILTHHLKDGCTLLRTVQDDGAMLLVYGEGKGCVLEVAGEVAGAWIPLRGALQINEGSLALPLRAKEMLTTSYGARINVIANGRGRWLAVLGGRKAWEQLFANTSSSDSHLLPERHAASRELRGKAIALARSVSQLESEVAMYGIAHHIVELQAPLHAAISRCPGRTYAKRRQVFMRLQRVHNFIAAHCDRELDNSFLAEMANYSPCYFLRIFVAVYFETPHDYLIRQRLTRAESLLRHGKLAVSEVASASGFRNASAFSRRFRRHFGKTAKETRRGDFEISESRKVN